MLVASASKQESKRLLLVCKRSNLGCDIPSPVWHDADCFSNKGCLELALSRTSMERLVKTYSQRCSASVRHATSNTEIAKNLSSAFCHCYISLGACIIPIIQDESYKRHDCKIGDIGEKPIRTVQKVLNIHLFKKLNHLFGSFNAS